MWTLIRSGVVYLAVCYLHAEDAKDDEESAADEDDVANGT